MVLIRINGRDKKLTRDHARHLGGQCRQLAQAQRAYASLEVLGPIEAPLVRIADHYRWQLLIKGGNVNHLHRFVRDLVFDSRSPARVPDVSIAIDVDPLFLM